MVAWGANAAGQLGDGQTSPGSDVPVNVKLPAGTEVIAIAVGGHHSLAVTSTGQVLAWGINVDGELGDGTTTHMHGPPKAGGPPKARLEVDSTPSGGALVKVRLPAGTKVTAVAAGDAHSCSNTSFDGGYSLALTSTGRVLAWGYNGYGELGDGKTAQSDVPVSVKLPAGTKVTAIAAGGDHSLAVTSTGQVLAWGDNAYGQLGDGRTTHSDVPATVKLPEGTKVTAIAAGNDHSLALTSTGQILAWGDDDLGQLGDGNTTQSHVPVTVRLPPGTRTVKLGAGSVGDYSLALVHQP